MEVSDSDGTLRRNFLDGYRFTPSILQTADNLGLGYFQVFADFACKMFVNFAMARDRCDFTRCSVYLDAVVGALSKKLRVVMFDVTDQIDPLH